MAEHAFELLVKDVRGAEGPCVDQQGRIFMVGPDAGRVLEVFRGQGGAWTTRDLVKYDGIPAGLQLDRDNDLWIADMKKGILRVTHEGELTHEVATFEDKPIRGCNDCSFDSQGNLYVTAPAGSGGGQPHGELFCRLADGKVVRLDGGYEFCNGIAVGPDDRLLIVAETFTKKLWAFDIVRPGEVKNKRHWGTLPGEYEGGPDGIDFDEEGHLLATSWGNQGIDIFDASGKHVDKIVTPFKNVSNLHFLGPGSKEIIITEHTTNGLWKTTHRCAGQKQYGWK